MCLGALANQTLRPEEMEVIVVDDGSTDDTAERVRRAAEQGRLSIRLLKGEGRGPAAARNLGWRAAQAPIALFTDDDCEPAPRRNADLVEFLEQNPAVAGVGGKITRIRDGVVPRFVDDEGYMTHPGADGSADYLVTANAGYRKAALQEVGGFNESFPCAGGEDPELSFRLRALGAKLAKIEGGAVLHNHPRTLLDLYRMNWRYGRGAFNLTKAGYNYSGTGMERVVWGWWKKSAKGFLRRSSLRPHERLSFSACRLAVLFGLWRGYHYQAKH
jgi:glycosyltransferase involved in cell wall biosynthesis